MKSIKSRLLKRFQSVPSTNISKHHVVPLTCHTSPDRLSANQTLQDLQLQCSVRQDHRTNARVIPMEEQCEPRLYIGKKNDLVMSELAVETDVFEECECEFDNSIPDMVTSSSSSSSSSSFSSPTRTKFTTETLLDFEEKCPPEGNDKVILYTTSLRGIRKTYEDCHVIKFLLEGLRVVYIERDVSMDLEFRDELWRILGCKSLPPRLFIKGREIGGADQVARLHELGILKTLLEGMPVLPSGASVKCKQCVGMRFLLCLDCNGSCKMYKGEQKNGGNLFGRCTKCNENGLIKCPTCSY